VYLSAYLISLLLRAQHPLEVTQGSRRALILKAENVHLCLKFTLRELKGEGGMVKGSEDVTTRVHIRVTQPEVVLIGFVESDGS
jgi:hypothetical protein